VAQIAGFSQIITKHIYTRRADRTFVEFLTGGTYRDHWVVGF